MSEEVIIDDSTPVFETIENLHSRSIPPTQDTDVVMDDDEVDVTSDQPVQPRRRGRPKGSKNRTKGSLPIGEGEQTNVKGRLAKDVSLRAQQVLKGASSIPAIWRPAFQMHDIEATNIADPLASYATRQAELSPVVAKLVDDFDLVAAIIGIGAYAVRVYKENGEWIAEHANERPNQRSEPSRTRQAPMEQSNGAVRQNQSTQRPQYETESNPPSPQDQPTINEYAPAVSVPYVGDL